MRTKRAGGCLVALAPALSPLLSPLLTCSACAARIQNLSFSRLNVCTPTRLLMSHTLMLLSSELLTMSSFFGWNMTQLTLFVCPLIVSTSHALDSDMRQSFTCRSSAADTSRGRVGWKLAQFTPRSCPSSTYFTTTSFVPNSSACMFMPAPPP